MAWYPPGGDSLPPLYWGQESAALTEAPWLQAGASDLPGLSFLLPQVCHSEIRGRMSQIPALETRFGG